MFKKVVLGFMGLAVASYAAYEWSNVQIWGGGYVSGVTFTPTGIAYARTDVGGSYRLNSGDVIWSPLNDSFTDGNNMGSIAITVDTDNESYVYATGGLYTTLSWCGGASFMRSADGGTSWTRIALKNDVTVSGANASMVKSDSSLCLAGNGDGRGMGNRIAVNGTTIFLGTNQNGLLKSTDRGDTWTTISGISNTSGVGAVFFDAAGNVYAAPYAGGLYKSTDGTAFTKLSGFTGVVYQASYNKAANVAWLTINSSGSLDQNNPSGGSVYKFDATAGTFSQVTMPSKDNCGGKDYGYLGVSVNSSDPNQVAVSSGGCWHGNGGPIAGAAFVPHEFLFMTLDGGTSWTDLLSTGIFDAASAYSSAASNPHWISALAINPTDKDHVIFGTGYGVWSTRNATDASPTWTFSDQGIEETVPLALVSSSYGAPLVSALGDVDGFYHSSLSTPPTMRLKTEDGVTEAGTNYVLDYAALDPKMMIRIHKESTNGLNLGGYSTDGGETWKNFGTHPPFVVSIYDTCSSGCDNSYSNETNYAAISADGSAIVWNMEQYGVYFSTDSGSTWTASSNATLATTLAGHRVVADRVTAGTFYIYTRLNGTSDSTGVLYKSTDNGANWTAANDTLEYDGDWATNYFRVFASPDAAGDLWITQGAHIYPCDDPNGYWCDWNQYTGGGLYVGSRGENNVVYHSTDGGTTLVAVDSLLYATYVGFGKGKTAGTSAVYAVGMVKPGITGIFRSDDKGSTWVKIDDVNHQYGGIAMVEGDPCIYSRIYITGAARGIIYGQEPGYANTCADRLDYDGTAIPTVQFTADNFMLERVGMNIIASKAVRLYDLSGRLVRSSQVSTSVANMSLMGISRGVYIAKSGSKTLTVNLQ